MTAASSRRVRSTRFASRLLIAGGLGLTLGLAGCGVGANSTPASLPVASVGPSATVGPAVAQTRGAIVSALSNVAVQFGDATRPYRPAESARLRNAPRAVYQVVLPDRPDAGFIVVYEFPDATAAVDAGNEEAGYLGTGPGRIQFPIDEQHVLRQLGPTLIRLLVVAERVVRLHGRRCRGSPEHDRDRLQRPALTAPGSARSAARRGDAEPPLAAHSRIGSRRIFSVWVRGKSSSGQSRQPAIRCCGPSVAFACRTAASTIGGRPTRRRARRLEEDDGLDPAGRRLDHDRVADPGDPERVLDVLGVDVEAVRQDDPVLRPAAEDRAGRPGRGGRCRRCGTSRRRPSSAPSPRGRASSP